VRNPPSALALAGVRFAHRAAPAEALATLGICLVAHATWQRPLVLLVPVGERQVTTSDNESLALIGVLVGLVVTEFCLRSLDRAS
jgi:hypothetical protein